MAQNAEMHGVILKRKRQVQTKVGQGFPTMKFSLMQLWILEIYLTKIIRIVWWVFCCCCKFQSLVKAESY